jgi:hypothetical protein
MNITIPWVESPFFETEIEKRNLTAEQKEMARFYAENGYLVLDPEISDETVDQAIADAATQYVGDSPRLQDGWKNSPAIKNIAGAKKILDTLNMLYGRETFPFQTLNFRVGSQQRTHSDSIHFHSIPERYMVGVWVALEDVNEDNGPLHYYPGSHKLPIYNMIDLGIKGSNKAESYEDYGKYEEFVGQLMAAKGFKKQTLSIKKGQALIWSANLFHGGEPIKKQGSSRHSQVIHYFFKDCTYYSPIWSDLAIEKLYMRRPMNVLTGEIIENNYIDESLTGRVGFSRLGDIKNKLERFISKARRSLK